MFCPECGTKLEEGSRFCPECGTRLDVNDFSAQIEKNTQPKIRQTKNMFQTYLVIQAIILIGLLYMAYQHFQKMCTPESVADEMFRAMVAKNYDKVYQILDVGDESFITKEGMEKYAITWDEGDVTKYSIGKNPDLDEELGEKELRVTYRVKGEKESYSYDMTLEKEVRKKFLFFDSWKVTDCDSIVNGYEFTIPAGAKISVGGKLLDDSFKTSEDSVDTEDEESDDYNDVYEDQMDTYQLNNIYNGKYEVIISKKGYETIREMIAITQEGYGDEGFVQDNLNFPQNTILELQKRAGEFIKPFVAGYMTNTPIDQLSEMAEYDGEIPEEISDVYYADSQWEHVEKMNSLKIGNISSTVADFSEGQVTIEVEYTLDADWKFDKEYLNNYFWSMPSEKIENKEYEADVAFYSSDGKWKIGNINIRQAGDIEDY